MIDDILADLQKMRAAMRPTLQEVVCGPAYSAKLAKARVPGIYGPTIRVSTQFPFQNRCPICEGTGAGETSTYCRNCHGEGETRVEGMMKMSDGSMIVLRGSTGLPPKFMPHWPIDIKVPLRTLPNYEEIR